MPAHRTDRGAMLKPGDPVRLGPYRLLDRLGEGGQGAVYLAQGRDGERVAVKLLHARHADGADVRARFLREIELARQVAEFCTARVLDAGESDVGLYVVSEYIEGVSLQKSVQREGPRSGPALHRIAVGTATALAAIHQAGIVHRDFKPANVLLGPDGPRVIDFGISRALDTVGTMTSGVVGTPTYMSPEQIGGQRVGAASDVFSWASTMVFAATGRPAFGHDSIPAVLNRILTADPDLSAVPADLRRLLAHCLAKDPAARPTASQVMLALIAHRPTPATAAPPVGPAGQAHPTGPAGQAHPVGPAGQAHPTGPPGQAHPVGPSEQAHPAGAHGWSSPVGPPVNPVGPPGPGLDTAPSRAGKKVAYGAAALACAAVVAGAALVAPAWLSEAAPSPTPSPVTTTGAPPSPSPTPTPTPTASPAPFSGAAVGKALGVMRGHTDDVETVATTTVDGRPVAVSGSRDHTVRLWDLATRKLLATFAGHTHWVRKVAVTDLEGSPIAVSAGDDGTIRVWDLTRRRPLGKPIDQDEPVFSLAVAQHGGRPVAITGGRDGNARVWDLTTREQIGPTRRDAHAGAVFSVAATAEGTFFTGGADGEVKRWSLDGGEGANVTTHAGHASVVETATLDGETVVLSGGGDQEVWVDEPAGGERRLPYLGHSGWVYSIAVAEVAGRTLVISGGNDGTARVHDLATGKDVGKPFKDHDHNVFGLATAVLGGRTVVVSAGGDNTLRVWRLT
ncbi:protein kinase [Nonomuraea sp. NPDC059194]|uniref:WD40 repeat domain-containing serine/threonine protein kinase n=1 Tax=Nonomuraea sp. NPDC059194 TaxID=3346764 RepID=UPI0036933CCA